MNKAIHAGLKKGTVPSEVITVPFRWQSAKQICPRCSASTAFTWRDESGKEFPACSALHAKAIKPEGRLILVSADRAQGLQD